MDSPEKIQRTNEILREYAILKENHFERDRPIEEVSFVVLDTETTGLDLKNDQLISLGAIKVLGRAIRVNESLEFLFPYSNANNLGSDHIAIHEITPQVSQREGTSLEGGLLTLLQFIGESVLIGHHVDFDLAMINRYLNAGFGISLHNKSLDTVQLAERFYYGSSTRNQTHYTLDVLCNEFNISLNDRHSAAGDAFITALLFLKLVNSAKQRGVHTIGSLLKKKPWWL